MQFSPIVIATTLLAGISLFLTIARIEIMSNARKARAKLAIGERQPRHHSDKLYRQLYVATEFRALKADYILCGGVATLLAVMIFVSAGINSLLATVLLPAPIAVALGFISAILIRRGRRSLKNQLRPVFDAGFVPCPSCLHAIQNDSDQGRCNECGLIFEIEALNKLWTETLA